MTHDALDTYVADRQQARMQAATASRTAALLRRARRAVLAAGPTGSAQVTPVPTPATSASATSSPVVAHATGAATGTPAGRPAATVLRTAVATGTPAVQDDPAAA